MLGKFSFLFYQCIVCKLTDHDQLAYKRGWGGGVQALILNKKKGFLGYNIQ
jgi:hypothetical protein